MHTTQAIAQRARAKTTRAHCPAARAYSQNDVTNDKLQFSKHMDSRVQRRSIINLAVEFFLLFPFLTYAITEILVCFFWNLTLRLFHHIFSLALDGYYSGKKTRQVTPNNYNPCQNEALIKSQLHKESNSPRATQASETDICRPAKSSEQNFGSFKKRGKTKKEESQTKENRETRTPRLITKQWVTQEIIWNMDRNTASLNEEGTLLHACSAAKCQSDAVGKHDVYSREEISTPDLADSGRKDSEWGLRKENAFICNLHVRAGMEDCESKELKGSCHPQVCSLSNLNAASSDSRMENVRGLTQANMPISDCSGVSEEKSHAGTQVISSAATGSPVEHRPTGTPAEYRPLPTALQTGQASGSKFQSTETLNITPTNTDTTPNRVNVTRLVQEGSPHTDSLTRGPPEDRRIKEEVSVTTNAVGPHESYGTLVVRKAKGKSSEKLSVLQHLGLRNENQSRVKATSSQPKLRTEHVKHSRLRFARAPSRSVLRNIRMPLL